MAVVAHLHDLGRLRRGAFERGAADRRMLAFAMAGAELLRARCATAASRFARGAVMPVATQAIPLAAALSFMRRSDCCCAVPSLPPLRPLEYGTGSKGRGRGGGTRSRNTATPITPTLCGRSVRAAYESGRAVK